MARAVADVRSLFEALAGPDAGDATSAPVPVRCIPDSEMKGLRIGLLESDALGKADSEPTAALHKIANALAAQGFIVEPCRITGLDRALELWWFFFGPAVAHLYLPIIAGREDHLSSGFRDYLQFARPESPLTLDAVLTACAQRDLVRADILKQLRDVPILLSPVSMTTAFKHGEGTWRPGAPQCYRETMRWTQWLNLTGFPGVSVPVAISQQGLPIGLQVIGHPFEDELALAVAEKIELARGPWQPPSL